MGGCKHVGVECLVAQANKMLMHYGCPSNNGLKLQASLEYLMIAWDVSSAPVSLIQVLWELGHGGMVEGLLGKSVICLASR